MENYDAIELAIQNSLKEFAVIAYQQKMHTSGWTYGIKEALGKLATQYDYDVCTSGFRDRHDPEWLYDLVWYRNDENNRLVSVPLVVESEWHPHIDKIKYDFDKLLLANAGIRLMIFQGYGESVIEIISELKKSVDVYNLARPGDRFLFAGLEDYDLGEFIFESYVKR